MGHTDVWPMTPPSRIGHFARSAKIPTRHLPRFAQGGSSWSPRNSSEQHQDHDDDQDHADDAHAAVAIAVAVAAEPAAEAAEQEYDEQDDDDEADRHGEFLWPWGIARCAR